MRFNMTAAGMPPSEGWRLVESVDPAAVEAWRAARAEFDAAEPAWRARTAAYQRDRGIARRWVPSPESKILQEAEAAVAARLQEMIESGELVFAGWKTGQLGGAPEVVPIALLGDRRPRGSQCAIRGIIFHDVRLFRASDLAEVEPA